MQAEFVNKSKNELPAYSTVNSAAMDLRANLDEPVVLGSPERALIPKELFIDLPEGFGDQVCLQSGLSFKKEITVLKNQGTIDADYRSKMRIILINLSKKDFVIENGERICQIIIAANEKVEWDLVETLEETERGAGGIDLTGKH